MDALGARAVSTGGEDASALPGPAGTLELLSRVGEVTEAELMPHSFLRVNENRGI